VGKITERDEEHGPSPQVLNGTGDAGWNGESSDYILRDEAFLSSLLIPNTDQRQFMDGNYLRPAGVIVVTTHIAGLRDYSTDVPLAGEMLGIERLKGAAPTIPMKHDRVNPDTHP
jgi:hypothetical protein